MREVMLYGALGREFGSYHRFDVASIPEAIQALAANFPGFLRKLRHGFYRVVVGRTSETGVEMDQSTVAVYKLGDQNIHIIPVTEGAGRGGLGKILAGILLVGLSMVTGGVAGALMGTAIGGTSVGAITASIGTGLVLTGVASLIAPEQESGEQEKSFTMAGPQVTLKEGGIVPIVYGDVVTGGTMISGVLKVENDLPTEPTTPTEPTEPTEPVTPGEPGEY